jgi:hypothetical protein
VSLESSRCHKSVCPPYCFNSKKIKGRPLGCPQNDSARKKFRRMSVCSEIKSRYIDRIAISKVRSFPLIITKITNEHAYFSNT